MKKLIFLLIFLPFVAVSQTNLNQSAEEFVKSYFKMFEDKKWDEIPKSFTDDCQMIGANYTPVPISNWMNWVLNINKNNLNSDKVDVKWISSDDMGKGVSMVSTRYYETVERSNSSFRTTDNIAVFLVVQNEGKWKIKKWFIQQSYPLLFDDHIDPNYQKGAIGPLPRFDGALNQMSNLMMYNLEYSMKNGQTPTEIGKRMGERYAKTWDQSKGFEGLVSGFVWGLQTGSNYVEILERDENTFKARFILFPISKTWEVSEQNILDFYKGMWDEIIGYMGGTYTLVVDGRFWVVTMNRK